MFLNRETQIDEFDYHLPPRTIAEFPSDDRGASKLLVVRTDSMLDLQFSEVVQQLPPSSLVILNNTRVIEARMLFAKSTGATIEIFCLKPLPPWTMERTMSETRKTVWSCMVGGAAKWTKGLVLEKSVIVDENPLVLKAALVAKCGNDYEIAFTWTGEKTFAEVLSACGSIPLPPYIKRSPTRQDSERYQTVFARQKGSVAAPTAALHFTPSVLDALENNGISTGYVTLHVGAGTFKPVKTTTIGAHQMHDESFAVTNQLIEQLLQAPLLVAVGTTSLRTLESLYWIGIKLKHGNEDLVLGQWDAYELPADDTTYSESLGIIQRFMVAKGLTTLHCRTSLLIIPGYTFRSAEALITNFHQPRSTLLLLVAAFIGDKWKEVYRHALNNNYRFLSYGDSSLLWKTT